MANKMGSAANSSSRRCFTFFKVATPPAPRTPLPTKFAVAEKHMADAQGRIGRLSSTMLLPVFRTVAQLVFDLRLRPMIVEHGVHETSTGRIRIAAQHVVVRGPHDGLCLLPCHPAIGLI